MWMQDESSREWKLVPVATDAEVAVARVEKSGDVAAATVSVNGDACTAVPVTITAVVNNNGGADDDATNGIRYHEVLPTDTFQGICLRYKVTPTELRRANRMMGTNLKLAPAKLLIPSNDKNQQLDLNREATKEEKIASLISKVSRITKNKLTYSEARAYLEIADWDVDRAVDDVREDFGWSEGQS